MGQWYDTKVAPKLEKGSTFGAVAQVPVPVSQTKANRILVGVGMVIGVALGVTAYKLVSGMESEQFRLNPSHKY